MRLEIGDLVEVVTEINHIVGQDIKPGMRGYVIGYSKRSQTDTLSWIVDFHGIKGKCYPNSIMRVPLDPGHTMTSWLDCVWKPAALRLKHHL